MESGVWGEGLQREWPLQPLALPAGLAGHVLELIHEKGFLTEDRTPSVRKPLEVVGWEWL